LLTHLRFGASWCVVVRRGASCTGKEVANLAGADNVHATFSSSGKNVACYSARINDEQASALRQLPVIQYVPQLVLSFLNLVNRR
jgi:hypothetical protein